jgi:hypothetical protein
MTGTLGYDDIRAATVRQVAQLMAAAAITAPKSGGQLFLAGQPNFMETVIADDTAGTPRKRPRVGGAAPVWSPAVSAGRVPGRRPR